MPKRVEVEGRQASEKQHCARFQTSDGPPCATVVRGRCVYGRREEIPLPQFAARLPEMIEMLRGFNTFRNHLQFQLMRQKDDHLDRVSHAPVGLDSANERM